MGEAFITRRGGGAPFTITELDPTIFNFLNDDYKTFNCPKDIAPEGTISCFIVKTNTGDVQIMLKPSGFMHLSFGLTTGGHGAITFGVGSSTSTAWVFSYSNYSASFGTPTKAYSYVIE